MIDNEGHRLYSEMMNLIWYEENRISEEVAASLAVFDEHMNKINSTKGMLYGKHGEVLMEC